MSQSKARGWATVALLTFSLSVISASAAATELIVSAASSLTNAFKELSDSFQERHPDAQILHSFAASDVLVQQMNHGAPVDVLASADQVAMDKAVQAGTVDPTSRVDFVQNTVVLIVPKDNPLQIQSVADLVNPLVTRVAYGNPQWVPVGRYTQQSLQETNQWSEVKARQVLGQNVRQVLDYVARGEVDAGFVFLTDALVMPDQVKVVETLVSPVPVHYPIAVALQSKSPDLSQAYIDYILSPEAQAILARHGFTAP